MLRKITNSLLVTRQLATSLTRYSSLATNPLTTPLMFRFEQIIHLYALAIIPILIFFFIMAMMYRKRIMQRFGESHLIQQLMPQVSKYKHTVKFILLILSMSLLCVAYANPQWGTKKEKVKRKSSDVFIALDVSESMLAQDLPPSRLDRAKQFTQKLIRELKGERIGTIIFAGNAYMQMPLTADYSSAAMFVKSASTRMVPTQGTAIGDAIRLATQSYDESGKFHKALIIITDGENHDQDALDQAKAAAEQGVLIFTIGVGTSSGSPIPTFANGQSQYKKDKQGSTVISKLNENMLSSLAAAGSGKYYNITNGEKVIEALQKYIETLEKQEFEQRTFSEYESYFQWFLALALLFLLIEFLLSYQKSEWWSKRDIFRV